MLAAQLAPRSSGVKLAQVVGDQVQWCFARESSWL
jgi:hypothetical protein